MELVLDKKIGSQSLFAKLKIRIESTLEEVNITDIQKKKFEAEDNEKSFEMSENSFSISYGNGEAISQNLANLS